MRRQVFVLVAVALVVGVAGVGCSAKKSTGPAGAEGTGIDEEGLAGEGSLADYQRGAMPGGEGPLRDITFGFDSDELDQAARDTLRENGGWLKENPGARVEIEGHCDERGTTEYNLALGARRSRSARDYLVTLGIAAERLNTISYGEELPLCAEHNEACWQTNRRVHFVVLSK